jgi:hypothetical protein
MGSTIFFSPARGAAAAMSRTFKEKGSNRCRPGLAASWWPRQDAPPMKEFLELAFRTSVAKRALKYAVVVGLILIAINHSDALLQGQVSRGRLFRMALTVLVPYVVSTISSVGALRERERNPGSIPPGLM